jgi:hypothetical protein
MRAGTPSRHNDRIPLFDAEKQQNTPVQAHRRSESGLASVDSAWIRLEFRCGAEQGNLAADQGN